jgi:hypothetical protein
MAGCHSLANCIYHLTFTLSLYQWLEGWKIKLLDHLTRSIDAVRLEAFTLEFLHQIIKFLLLFFLELVFRNRNLVFFTNCRFICEFHHVESFVSHRACQKMCWRKNQHTGNRGQVFTESQKSQPSVPVNLTCNWQERKQNQIWERIGWDSEYLSGGRIGKLCRYYRWQKDIKCERVVDERIGRISRYTRRQNRPFGQPIAYVWQDLSYECVT